MPPDPPGYDPPNLDPSGTTGNTGFGFDAVADAPQMGGAGAAAREHRGFGQSIRDTSRAVGDLTGKLTQQGINALRSYRRELEQTRREQERLNQAMGGAGSTSSPGTGTGGAPMNNGGGATFGGRPATGPVTSSHTGHVRMQQPYTAPSQLPNVDVDLSNPADRQWWMAQPSSARETSIKLARMSPQARERELAAMDMEAAHQEANLATTGGRFSAAWGNFTGSRGVRIGGAVIAAGVYSGARYLATNEDTIRYRDQLMNQFSMASGGQDRWAIQRQIGATGARAGQLSSADYLGGLTTLRGVSGSTDATDLRYRSAAAAMGNLATLSPGIGSTAAAGAFGEFTSPQTINALRMVGITARPGGRAQDPMQIFSQLSQRVWGSRAPSQEQVNAMSTQGTAANLTVRQFFGEGQLAQSYLDWSQASARLGRPVGSQADMREAGVTSNAVSSLGQRRARGEAFAGERAEGEVAGLMAADQAAGALSDSLSSLEQALGPFATEIERLTTGLSNAVRSLTGAGGGVGNAALDLLQTGLLLRGARGAAGGRILGQGGMLRRGWNAARGRPTPRQLPLPIQRGGGGGGGGVGFRGGGGAVTGLALGVAGEIGGSALQGVGRNQETGQENLLAEATGGALRDYLNPIGGLAREGHGLWADLYAGFNRGVRSIHNERTDRKEHVPNNVAEWVSYYRNANHWLRRLGNKRPQSERPSNEVLLRYGGMTETQITTTDRQYKPPPNAGVGDPAISGMDSRLRQGLEAMFQDNPKLRLNSGKRSHAEQDALHRAGVTTVPGGHDEARHQRGQAADIGPDTEYGWIAANAHKYGLETVTPGEPWHVEAQGTRSPHSKHRSQNAEAMMYEGADATSVGKIRPGEHNLKPHVIMARRFIQEKWGLNDIGGYGQRANASDHPKGLALDAMTYKNTKLGDQIAEWFVNNPDVFGTKYVIWKQRIQNPPGTGWRKMEDRGSVTANHFDHPHISFEAAHNVDMTAVPMDGSTDDTGSGGSGFAVSHTAGSQYGSHSEAEVIAATTSGAGGGVRYAGNTGSAGRGRNGSSAETAADTGGGGGRGWAAIERGARSAGMRGSHLTTMMAIAMAESDGNPRAHNAKPPDNSYGLWQINMIGNLGPARRREFGISSNEALFDPATNARAAQKVYQSQGYRAWSVYSSGKYRTHIKKAEAQAASPGIGDPPLMDMPTGGTPGGRMAAGAESEGSVALMTPRPTQVLTRTLNERGGSSKRAIHIHGGVTLKVTMANGSRAEVEKLFETLEEYGASKAREDELAD